MHSMEELNLVLQWLQSRKKIAVVRGIQPVDLVKFPKNGVLPVKVSEADTGIFLLEKHETFLKMNIEKLEKEKEEALNEARKYVVAKMKPMVNMLVISLNFEILIFFFCFCRQNIHLEKRKN